MIQTYNIQADKRACTPASAMLDPATRVYQVDHVRTLASVLVFAMRRPVAQEHS